ncbi:MAG TPA: PLP-dependent transferase, partial [Gemmatimonadota bacterium]|nr:PLP-dependent transferase [Gemmatimonadota bacterium]
MMRYGYRPDWSMGAIKSPIFQTSTFAFRSAAEGKAFFEVAYGLREPDEGEDPGLIYSRLNHPDLQILEDRLTLWDGAEAAVAFESGMAAIASTLLTFLRPGDVVLHSDPLYGGTDWLFNHVLTEFGITPVGFLAGSPPEAVEEAVRAAREIGRLAMIYVETPANPTNALVDIELCVRLAREAGDDVRVAVDNTFLGPLWQHPLKLGADLVLYSLTKYAGGHSDLIAGACLGSAELVSRVRATRTFLGTTTDPWTGWLLLRSLETMKLRMTCQMENARRVADFLAGRPEVERVHYLGHLPEGDPQRAVYDRQCLAPGGMISFDIRGGEAGAFRFLDALEMVYLA